MKPKVVNRWSMLQSESLRRQCNRPNFFHFAFYKKRGYTRQRKVDKIPVWSTMLCLLSLLPLPAFPLPSQLGSSQWDLVHLAFLLYLLARLLHQGEQL